MNIVGVQWQLLFIFIVNTILKWYKNDEKVYSSILPCWKPKRACCIGLEMKKEGPYACISYFLYFFACMLSFLWCSTGYCPKLMSLVKKATVHCCCEDFNTARHLRHMKAVGNMSCTCICTALLSWIIPAHLVPLSITKHIPVHFILNPGQAEYELGVLMVWKFSWPSGLRTHDLLLVNQEH